MHPTESVSLENSDKYKLQTGRLKSSPPGGRFEGALNALDVLRGSFQGKLLVEPSLKALCNLRSQVIFVLILAKMMV